MTRLRNVNRSIPDRQRSIKKKEKEKKRDLLPSDSVRIIRRKTDNDSIRRWEQLASWSVNYEFIQLYKRSRREFRRKSVYKSSA